MTETERLRKPIVDHDPGDESRYNPEQEEARRRMKDYLRKKPLAEAEEIATAIFEDAREAVRRHPNSARFHELIKEIAELHDRKQMDYGAGDDPFANVRASEQWGVSGWVGAFIRLSDKVQRLKAFAQRGSLANESAEDSMRDIAVYALIALVLYEEESRG